MYEFHVGQIHEFHRWLYLSVQAFSYVMTG